MKLGVFYHCYIGGAPVWVDQVDAMINSGLLHDYSTDVHVHLVDQNPGRGWDCLPEDLRGLPVNQVKLSEEEGFEERETLLWLHVVAQKDPTLTHIMYHHTKGATSEAHHPTVRDWRQLMDYFLLWQWRAAATACNRHNSVAGCNWGREPFPHFSGNCWIASADYVRGLPMIDMSPMADRLAAEKWIGQNDPNVVYLHQSGVNHYTTPYPKERYR
jgi:hypothetical protein